jgi:hypothetical protein
LFSFVKCLKSQDILKENAHNIFIHVTHNLNWTWFVCSQADRVSGIPTRKTPYSRGGGHVPQMTAFGFRRRVPPNNSPLPQPQTGTPVTPSTTTHMIGPSGRSSGRCSPHFPPTPPPIAHNPPPVNTTQIQTKPATSALPKPLTNRFGFQLSQRCAAVLNNINAQVCIPTAYITHTNEIKQTQFQNDSMVP